MSSPIRVLVVDVARNGEIGAVDFVPKPSGSIVLSVDEIHDMLLEKVRLAAKVKVRLSNAPPRNGVRPAIDNTMESAVDIYGKNYES